MLGTESMLVLWSACDIPVAFKFIFSRYCCDIMFLPGQSVGSTEGSLDESLAHRNTVQPRRTP